MAGPTSPEEGGPAVTPHQAVHANFRDRVVFNGPAYFGGPGASSPTATTSTRRVKVFLVSSGELKPERDQIEKLVSQMNRRLLDRGFFIDLVLWEDQLQSFRRDRAQDGFNERLLECEVVICLFFKRVGRFSEEEFRLAFERLRAGQNPHYLFVYFKNVEVRISEVDEDVLGIRRLRQEIAGAEQIYCDFDSTDGLLRQVREQLDLVLAQLNR